MQKMEDEEKGSPEKEKGMRWETSVQWKKKGSSPVLAKLHGPGSWDQVQEGG